MKMRAPLAILLLLWAAPAKAAEIFPFAEVKPGMVGVGRTVFEGSRVEEFKVSVIGVLENALGPKQGLILGRLEGGPLEKTGVIAGMSGSPVFIEGRLVGAVAYSYPFAKETIAGITPRPAHVSAGNNRALQDELIRVSGHTNSATLTGAATLPARAAATAGGAPCAATTAAAA